MRLVILMFILAPVSARGQAIDPTLARQYFDEAEAACRADSGKLWGVSLCGPMLFADPKTRALVANRADREGQLTSAGAVFVGGLPEKENISNSALDWSGVRWTMVMWPLPHDPAQRRQLMLHELFHRIQDSIGLRASNPANAHLDSTQGRLWLQLEWRALERALTTQGDARRQAVEDALIFRAYRRSLFPQASGEERSLEMHEGLSEYTGVKLSGWPDAEMHRKLAEQMEEARHVPSFVRSFAYESGPAYGILLDDAGAAWRSGLEPGKDLGALLAGTMQIRTAGAGPELKVQAEDRKRRYGGDQIQAEEVARAERLHKILSEYRARLVEGPVLIIPLRKMNVQFDPNNLQPLEGLGTVYPNIRVSDEWGTLTVSSGALLSNDWTKITVPAPRQPDETDGDGWELKLQPGWKLAPGERKGDYILVRDSRASNMRLRSEPHL